MTSSPSPTPTPTPSPSPSLPSTTDKLRTCVHYLGRSDREAPDYNSMLYIPVFATAGFSLIAILIFFSPYRRRSPSPFLQAALWASHVLPSSIISNTLGLMQSRPYGNEAYAIWAVLFLLICGICNSNVYGVPGELQGRSQLLDEVVLLYFVGWLMYLHHDIDDKWLSPPLIIILGVAAVKFLFRVAQTSMAYSPSCKYFGLRRRMKLVADFMAFEHELSRSPRPATMEGYKYLVKGEKNMVEHKANKEDCQNYLKKNANVVTVDRIWQCKGALLGSSSGGEKLKDKCLSFSLFRLLVLRWEGFKLPEKHYSKNWDLVRGELLSKQNKYERIFRVIEDELSFLYDYVYTQYPFVFSDGKFFIARTAIYAFLELVQFIAALWIIPAILFSGNSCLFVGSCESPIWSNFQHSAHNRLASRLHFVGTCIFVAVYVVLQIRQLLTVMFSNWAKVWLLCEYVRRPWWQGNQALESFIRFICGWKQIPSKPWRRKMGQYFLLSSYNYRPVLYFFISAIVEVPKRGQKISPAKIVDPDVKSFVLDFWMENDCRLTNGLASLRRNNIDSQLACTRKSLTDRILAWHVATSFCFMEVEYGKEFGGKKSAAADVKQKRELAECLSGYCAYLVAFVPALLSDPADATEEIFDKAISDARRLLENCKRPREVYHKLKELGTDEHREEVVVVGARLGMQLVFAAEADEVKMWKVLADFWAEMMLFISPSDDVAAHVESLANGGEFITHLWALFTHLDCSRENSQSDQQLQDTQISAFQPMDETINPVP